MNPSSARVKPFSPYLLAALAALAAACGQTGEPFSPPTAPGAVAVAPRPAGALRAAPAGGDPRAVHFARCLAGDADAACFDKTMPPAAGSAAAAASAPSNPSSLIATVNGNSVALTWTAPLFGDPPTTYVIEAGTAPGLSDLANFATGNTATTYAAIGVGPGTYYARVRAANSVGTSSPSNEAVMIVGAVQCPGPPSNLLIVSNTGGNIFLSWSAGSGSLTSYVLEAGSASGLSNINTTDLGGTATSYSAAGVPNGTYYIRVRARNACGTSAPSNEVVLTVGAAAPPPTLPPTLPPTPPIASQRFTGTLAPYSWRGHLFNALATGYMTARLSWTDSFVDLDLYLTRSTCVSYPPRNCTILQSSTAVNTNFESVTRFVVAGEGYGVFADSWSTVYSQAYVIDVTYQPATMAGAMPSPPTVRSDGLDAIDGRKLFDLQKTVLGAPLELR